MSEEDVFFGTSSKTPLTSNDEIKKYFETVFAKYSLVNVELGTFQINELSNNGAVLTGFDKWNVAAGDKTFESIGRISITMALREGKWLIVSFHRSVIPN